MDFPTNERSHIKEVIAVIVLLLVTTACGQGRRNYTTTYSGTNNDGRPIIRIRNSKTTTTPKPEIKLECGHRNSVPVTTLIAGGNQAHEGEFPWHAGVYFLGRGNVYINQCGATLLTTKIIISAAHCFYDDGRSQVIDHHLYKIGLGKWRRAWDADTDDVNVQRRDVAKIVLHPRYKSRRGKYQWDIALAVMTDHVTVTRYVDVICMDWDNSFEHEQFKPGVKGLATGWGVTLSGKTSELLQWVELPRVSEAECLQSIADNRDSDNYYTADKFCAGHRGKSTSVCRGDSGGSLVFFNSTTNTYFLRGIISISFDMSRQSGACTAQQYTGFTTVSAYLDWLRLEIFKNSL